MEVKQELQALVAKLHQLSPKDLTELQAFIDYLQKGAEKIDEIAGEHGKSLKLYHFMDGGLEEEKETKSDSKVELIE